jgi:hypothetical protein
MTNHLDEYNELLKPYRIWQGNEILSGNVVVPKESGIYAWYFRNFPTEIPTTDCITHNGWTLLYIGIAPTSESSRGNLCGRIKNHLRGNAYGSTLRLSLGCLLSCELKIQLRRVSTRRMTFTLGETKLSEWMAENASVVWLIKAKPWLVEASLVQQISLPLNLEYNQYHPFYPVLLNKRENAKKRARELPIVNVERIRGRVRGTPSRRKVGRLCSTE